MHRSVRPMHRVCFFAPWYFRKQKIMTQCWFNVAHWTDTALQLLMMVVNQLHIEKCTQLTFIFGDISLKLCNPNWHSTISVWFLPHLLSKSNKHILLGGVSLDDYIKMRLQKVFGWEFPYCIQMLPCFSIQKYDRTHPASSLNAQFLMTLKPWRKQHLN